MVNLIKILEMTPVASQMPQDAICPYDDCVQHGNFMECYLHTHCWCEKFDAWYHAKYISNTQEPDI